jgi:multiple antibiotic resistance protein
LEPQASGDTALPGQDAILNAFITMLVTIDPPGLAPIFLALTAGMNREQRLSVALRASATGFLVLVAFILAGAAVLSALGITIHAFRVAGGLLLFAIAFEMIFERRDQRRQSSSERAITRDHIANIATFPLAVPLIAGPGAISATVLLSTQFGAGLASLVLIGILFAVIVLVLASFWAAERIDRYLGETGRSILTRLLGLLLAALSVQFVADGVRELAKAG